jgi:hypothetical protein
LLFKDKRKHLTGDAKEFFGFDPCNWAQARLECIPNKGRDLTTTTTSTPDPTAPPAPPEEEKEKLKGTCQCMRALGEKSLFDDDSELPEGDRKPKCVIPADLGRHSDCNFDLVSPYGEIVEPSRSTKRSHLEGSTMCIKNSECTAGYLYTGLRCHCKKGTKWMNIGACKAPANSDDKLEAVFLTLVISILLSCIV